MKKQQPTNPIDSKEEVKETKDKHITQDFPGYPHPPATEKTIKKDKTSDEQQSDGSANAFSESELDEDVLRGEMDDDNNKNY